MSGDCCHELHRNGGSAAENAGTGMMTVRLRLPDRAIAVEQSHARRLDYRPGDGTRYSPNLADLFYYLGKRMGWCGAMRHVFEQQLADAAG